MAESVEQGTHLSLYETLNILNMEMHILLDSHRRMAKVIIIHF